MTTSPGVSSSSVASTTRPGLLVVGDAKRAKRHRASGSGRIWKCITLLGVPFPPSMWNGARVDYRGPHAAALPSAFRIVDAPVHPLRVEAERVRHAHHDPLAVLEREQSFRQVAGVDRRVRAEAERVELIDPRVVAALGAAAVGDAFHLRQRLRIERPALRAVLPGRRRSVERHLALAAIEARHVTAGERRPVDAVAIDVAAARREPFDRRAVAQRQLVHLGERGFRRIRSRIQADDRARKPELRAPHRSVGRRRHRIEGSAVPLVLRRIDRLRSPRRTRRASVAVRVHDERRPALRLRSRPGLVEHLAVQPADDLTAAARPQRVIRVLGEHQVVRAEAGADVRELPRLRVVHREMPGRAIDRRELRRRMGRSGLAVVRVVERPDRRGDPHAALFVEHRVVDVVLARPDRPRCPSTATAAACSARSAACSGSRTVSSTALATC